MEGSPKKSVWGDQKVRQHTCFSLQELNFESHLLRYIVGLIIKTSSSPDLMEKERTYLNKLNLILVSILKRWNSSPQKAEPHPSVHSEKVNISPIFISNPYPGFCWFSTLFHYQGVAEKLGKFHPWHHWSVEDQRVAVPEQHGHPKVAQRGGLWLQLWSDDTD